MDCSFVAPPPHERLGRRSNTVEGGSCGEIQTRAFLKTSEGLTEMIVSPTSVRVVSVWFLPLCLTPLVIAAKKEEENKISEM